MKEKHIKRSSTTVSALCFPGPHELECGSSRQLMQGMQPAESHSFSPLIKREKRKSEMDYTDEAGNHLPPIAFHWHKSQGNIGLTCL